MWYDEPASFVIINADIFQLRVNCPNADHNVSPFRYPSYEFVSDGNISTLASKVQTRYSVQSLYGVIFDVRMLSECDYIVYTFSSQVRLMKCKIGVLQIQSSTANQ